MILENLKAIQIISTFSQSDMKEFKKFLQSPYFNSRKQLIDLFSFIIKFQNNWTDPEFTYENLFHLLHPGEVFDKIMITKSLSSLFKLLETYVVVRKIQNDPISEKVTLLNFYNKYNLNDLYKDVEKEIERELKNVSDTGNYLTQLLFDIEKVSYNSTKDKRVGDINYQNTSRSLDTYFIYTKLKMACLMLNRSLIIPVKYDITLLNGMVDEELLSRFDSPAINCYYLAFRLLSEPSSKALYENLKYQLMILNKALPLQDLALLFTFLETATTFVFHDKSDYYINLFDIYNQQIQNKTIYYFDNIHRSALKNIITVALNLNKTEWAELFLKNHEKKIIPEHNAAEIYFFCLSEIYLAQKNYDKALVALSKVKAEDIFIKLSLRRTYLKIYYETNEFNVLDSNINAFRVYLSREISLTEDKLLREKNFVNAIQRMAKLKADKRESDNESLWNKIKMEDMVDKSWVEEKLTSKRH